MKRILSILLLTIIALSTFTAFTVTSTVIRQQAIAQKGNIIPINLVAYTDANCTIKIVEIDWGELYPDTISNRTIFLRGTGNKPLTLTIEATYWNPETAGQYLDLGTDYSNQTVGNKQVLSLTIFLSVSSDIKGVENFTFNILIIGMQME
jgi:hypothetical protein